jgi:hypothetical protein
MSRNTLTLVQEVYFDLCDLLDHNKLARKIKGFYEFDDLRDFVEEQRRKMALIEKDLDFGEDA